MTAINGFYINIENSTGTAYGNGPITEALWWEYTARFDRVGSFAFAIPATVEKAAHIQNERIARAYALIDDTWTEVGAGPINDISRSKGEDGRVSLVVRGDDLLRELTYRSVGNLTLDDPVNIAITQADALDEIDAFFPSGLGWTVTPDSSPPQNEIYGRFNGESALAALLMVADRSESHFYRGAGRTVIFDHEFTDSGIRAIQADALSADTCAIRRLTQQTRSYDLFTRIYPRGSGNGDIELTLKATTRTADSGYALHTIQNYLEHTSTMVTYGQRDRRVDFKNIGPISNTAADMEAAANALYDAAKRELDWARNAATRASYTLEVAQCSALLRPLQTIHVTYIDDDEGLDIDDDLNILETTWRVQDDEIQTTRLIVSTDDRWPRDDVDAIADEMTRGRIYQALPQISANSYWENAVVYVGESQTDHMGEFPFIFGDEVVQLQQVVFRYRVDEAISLTSTTAASSTSSGPSSATSSASGSDHVHEIPDHQHVISVTGSSSAEAALISNSGGLGFLEKASAGNVTLNTTMSGGTTSEGEDTHTHNIEHTHTFTPSITVSYGIYRATVGNTYALADLEFDINSSGSWTALSTGTSVGGGYYEIDITSSIQDSDTLRPNQENNLIRIRRTTAAGAGKTAMIYIKLGVRNSIQSILYS